MAECNCGTGSLPIIKQGDAYAVQVSLTFNGGPIVYSDLDLIEEIEFTFGELAPMRFKPKDIYNTTIGAFLVPLTQEQTFMLEDGKILVDCRVQFWGGDVVGVARMVRIFVREALSWEILPEKPYHEITPPAPGDVLVLPLTVTANGTYTAPSGAAYSPVVVNVPQGSGDVVRASWHQCPEAVRNYLAYVAEHPYSTSDWTVSYIADYAPSSPNVANTKPVGYTIDGATFYDNEPLVATPFATEHEAGTLTALDHLRWFNTHTQNARDLGGWACDGGTVKYGMLVRGGLPLAAYAAEDKALMVDKVGIRSELQLYGGSDDQYHYDEVSLWGIDWYGTDDGFIWYTLGRRDLWQYNLNVIFDSVLHSKPVYFHCGAGKDRTGTVAVMLLALLGVSQSDIDQDYELTTFATGSGNGITTRTGTDYKNFITSLHAYPLANGLSDTLQNHAFSFVISLGFSVDTVNNFRAACIDGTPSIITPTAPSYTITNSLSNCVTNNNQSSLVEGSTYSAAITANSGYTLDGATVSITMGGTDITSTAYNNGAISIASVTGNVVITIAAAEEQIEIINLANPQSSEWKNGYRIRGTAEIVAQNDSQVTNLIPVSVGDTIRVKNAGELKTYIAATFSDASATQGTQLGVTRTYDSTTGIVTMTVNTAANPYARFSFLTADVVGTVNDIVITRNQPIS